MILIFYILNK